MHEICGRLRGRDAPSEAVLDRLRALMGPRVRVSWVPVTRDGDGVWMLTERVGEPWYRACGRAILDRYAAEGVAPSAAVWYAAECMLDGDHTIATYTDQQFGTDWMFAELAQNEANVRPLLAAIAAAQRATERTSIAAECAANPDFASAWLAEHQPATNEAIDAVTDRWYDRVVGKVSSPVLSNLESV